MSRGRKKGVPNKTTADVRAAIALFAQSNIGKLQEWLDRIAVDDPVRAADLYLRALEYHVPKLGRTEMTGAEGEPVTVIEIVSCATEAPTQRQEQSEAVELTALAMPKGLQ